MYETITLEQRDAIAILTLNRARQRNALSVLMRGELAHAIEELRDRSNLRALVLTGVGGNFCAGGDLRELTAPYSPFENKARVLNLHRWFDALLDLPLPVIAVVDGAAYGAGFSLALAADFVLATTRARFCSVFVRVGLIPDLGALRLLPNIVGLQKAKDIILSGRTVTAQEAAALGIVTEIIDGERPLMAGIAYAERFAEAPTETIGITKSIINKFSYLDRGTLAELEAYGQAVAKSSEYHKNAVQRFLNKEPLKFDWTRLISQKDS